MCTFVFEIFRYSIHTYNQKTAISSPISFFPSCLSVQPRLDNKRAIIYKAFLNLSTMSRLLSFTSLILFLYATLAFAGASTGPQPGTKAYNSLPDCGCPPPGGRAPLPKSVTPVSLKIRGLYPDGEQGLLGVRHYPRAMTCRPTTVCG